MVTVVVHKRDKHDIFIGWPSKWGNPFITGRGDVYTRDIAIEKYRAWIMGQPSLLADLHELRGKRLGCYCAPKRCHGDVLAELANALPEDEFEALLG